MMAELRCSVVFVGMVADGGGAAGCRRPVRRRSRLDPCMPAYFGVGRLARGLFMVKLWLLQRFSWCMVVLAASWLACLALVSWRCSGRLRGRMLFV